MPGEFIFQARDGHGGLVRGRVRGDDRARAAQQLIAAGLFPLSINPARRPVGAALKLPFKPGRRELSVFYGRLSVLLKAGIPLVSSLDALEEGEKNRRLASTLRRIKRGVAGGLPLWACLQDSGGVFPPVCTGIVRAGEEGGHLTGALDRLQVWLDREEEAHRHLVKATLYPAVVSICVLALLVFLLAWVMPQVAEAYRMGGVEVPAVLKHILAFRRLAAGYFAPAAILLPLAAGGLAWWKRTPAGREFCDRLLFKIPLLGALAKKLESARFMRTLAALIRSGVPLLGALLLAEEAAGNRVMARAAEMAGNSVGAGHGITLPLRASGVFDPVVLQLAAVGEETGSLADMLEQAADYLEKDAGFMAASLTSLLEPFLVLFLAALIGAIIIGCVLPVLEMTIVAG